MKKIKQEYHIMAPLSEVGKALIDPKVIDKWGAGPAKMSDVEGYKFSLWGGDIHGRNTKVVKNKKLVQEWYGGDWPKASKVTFTLTHKDGCTTLYLLHEDVPDEEVCVFCVLLKASRPASIR